MGVKVSPGNVRFVLRIPRLPLCLCFFFLSTLPGCQKTKTIENVNVSVQDPTLTADLVPVSLITNNLHAADTFWLAEGDLAEVNNAQQYSFEIIDLSNPQNDVTCIVMFTTNDCNMGRAVPVSDMGFPLPQVDVVECPGQSSNCMARNGNVVKTFLFHFLMQLQGQSFVVANEDATYFLRPAVAFGTDVFPGALVSPMKINAVPKGMMGRVFSPALTFNAALQSGEKWQFPANNAPFTENFGSSLQVTTISVARAGQPILFCGVSVGGRNCGCNGDRTLSRACQSVDLRQCTDFNGLVVTPTYILSGVSDQLSSPDDRLQWLARFATQGCGLSPPPEGTDLTLNFSVIVR